MALTSYVPRSQRYERVACIDFETYYSKTYSLRAKGMSTTDYIRHPEYKTQCMGIQLDDWEHPEVYAGDDIAGVLGTIDWSRTAIVCHHAHFDGLILTHHYGIHPAFWLDTLSMSRTIFGTDVPHSHIALCERLGRKAKLRAGALVDTQGKRDLTEEELDALADYCADDVEQCLANYRDMSKALKEDELRIIDATVRMYVEPVLHLNAGRIERLLASEIEQKRDVFEAAGEIIDLDDEEFESTEDRHEAQIGTLKSANKFADQLRALGVEPPMKKSLRTGLQTYAFSKQDLAFKALEQHPDTRVRTLVKARLRSKSELIEARSRRLLGYAGHPLPIYLSYWAAHTGRWGGGDSVNWQNLPRRGDGAELRRAIEAAPGHLLVFSDSSQIEARMNAWDSGQWDKVEAFAAGVDIYRRSAAQGYDKSEDEITDDERFVFKTLELGGGYGAGAPKINLMFKLGQFGPPVIQSIDETHEFLARWRQANHAIVAKWKQNERDVYAAFLGNTSVESGPVVYEGWKGDGFMHLPGGTYVRYPKVWYDPDNRQLFCQRGKAEIKLYGGILTENRIQALARKLLVWQILLIEDTAGERGILHRFVNTTHDEIMYHVREEDAHEFANIVKEAMTTTPPWAEGLPVNAKTEVSSHYSKS